MCTVGSAMSADNSDAVLLIIPILLSLNPVADLSIYYGLYVAESKFRSDEEHFTKLIQKQDSQGLMDSITKPDVEKKIIDRVVLKAK